MTEDEAAHAHGVTEIEIPGERTFSHSAVPCLLVSLPLAVRPHRGMHISLCLIFLIFELALLLTDAALMLDGSKAFRSAGDTIVLSIVFLFIGYVGLLSLLLFWQHLTDVVRKGPALVISAEGFTDFRTGMDLQWLSVKSAQLKSTKGGLAGILLYPHAGMVALRHPSWRTVLLGHRSRTDRISVQVRYLEVRRHIVAHTILALVQKNGGEVVTKQ